MIQALNNKGYNAYAFSVPSPKELLIVFELAGSSGSNNDVEGFSFSNYISLSILMF